MKPFGWWGTKVVHNNYNPSSPECGEGNFTLVQDLIFDGKFRSTVGDKYIAIEINKKDLFYWKNGNLST